MTGGLFGKVDMGMGGICPDSSPSAFLSPCLDVHLQMQLPVKPFSIFHVNSTSHSNFKGCQTTGEAAGHVALQPRSTRVGSAAQRFLQRTSPGSLPLYEGTFDTSDTLIRETPKTNFR